MMVRGWRILVGCAALCAFAAHTATAQEETSSRKSDDRAFALVYDAEPVSYNGTDTTTRSTLKDYVAAHSGRYLVFENRGSLYRLDDATSVAEAERRLALLRPLEAQEHALGDQQRPLEQQMRELGAKLHSAPSSADQSAIGEQMSKLGQRMGQIGNEQGRVGNQMGKIANDFYSYAQALFRKCLAGGTCRRV